MKVTSAAIICFAIASNSNKRQVHHLNIHNEFKQKRNMSLPIVENNVRIHINPSKHGLDNKTFATIGLCGWNNPRQQSYMLQG